VLITRSSTAPLLHCWCSKAFQIADSLLHCCNVWTYAPLPQFPQCMLHCCTAPLLLLQLAAMHDRSPGLHNSRDVEVIHVLQGRLPQVLQHGAVSEMCAATFLPCPALHMWCIATPRTMCCTAIHLCCRVDTTGYCCSSFTTPLENMDAPRNAWDIVAGAGKVGFEQAVCCNMPALPCPAYVMHCNSKSSGLKCTASVLHCIQTWYINDTDMNYECYVNATDMRYTYDTNAIILLCTWYNMLYTWYIIKQYRSVIHMMYKWYTHVMCMHCMYIDMLHNV